MSAQAPTTRTGRLGPVGRVGLIAASALLLAGCGAVPFFGTEDPPDQPPTGSNWQDLADSCTAGNMESCDQLFRETPVNSHEEAWGDSCGARQDVGTGRWCVDAFGERADDYDPAADPFEVEVGDDGAPDDPPDASSGVAAPTGSDMQDLVDSCTDGDMADCDELYRESPLGSDEEAWGDTCGGRQDEGTGRWCVDAFGEQA